MQNHSYNKPKIVCDHHLGLEVYSVRLDKKPPHRFLRRAVDEQLEFIASVEYGRDGWQVNLPDFDKIAFTSKAEATSYVKALIALNY
jgi:hypothetical protein